ncbi:MAG: DUF6311 domain-containing protein [Sterolibacterium sp.]|nr:DUF6311 domain-containing protein [Sterolibacterium sp.]
MSVFIKMCFSKIPKISGAWWSMLFGCAAFWLITGGKILWPTYTDWLMDGDPATHWLGWQFFRYSPFFQWPIGANPNYGMEIGSSIVFTDSIPLLAFIFKPLNAFLPEMFQYTGLWILICFSLQSFFAWKLLALFTQDKWLPIIGCVFFLIAPVFLWRLQVVHYALLAQWVLLAGLYFYFAKKTCITRWIVLLAATALIQAYLLAMVTAIWLADLIQRRWIKQTGNVETARYFLVGSLSIAFSMWAAGYFMLGSGIASDGYGFYRMNLLSVIDPNVIWSKLFRDQEVGGGWNEGFNYFGIGMLGLGFIAGYEFLRNPKISYEVKIIPITIISIGLFCYALSNHVAAGAHELFSYGLPWIIRPLTNTFRVAGRFFWPVYYLIFLLIFYFLFTRLKRRVAITFCVAMLVIQVIDSTDAWHHLRKKYSHSAVWVSPMASPLWGDIAQQCRKIIVVLPANNSATNWMPLSQFAAAHRMAINTGYFARINPKKEQETRENITASVVNNELSPDSLYVFNDDVLWRIASSHISASDVAGVLDGFRIIAPNLKECRTCNTSAVASISGGGAYDFERIYFSSNGTGQKYKLLGWSAPENWGTWSDGDTASLLLDLSSRPKNDLELLIDGHAFLADKHPSQEVDILVNNHHAATLNYNQQHNSGVRVVKIPKVLALEKNGQLLIKFNFKNAKSPAELGLSEDARRLGLGIVSLELRPEISSN